MENGSDDWTDGRQREFVRILDTTGWGVFFIWVGVAFLADFGWGVGLLGVGVITLAGQALRRYLGVPVESFGLMVGLLFAFSGAWSLLGLQLGEPKLGGLMPAVSIVVGVVFVVSALRRGRNKRTRRDA